jgi:hypothetical protein
MSICSGWKKRPTKIIVPNNPSQGLPPSNFGAHYSSDGSRVPTFSRPRRLPVGDPDDTDVNIVDEYEDLEEHILESNDLDNSGPSRPSSSLRRNSQVASSSALPSAQYRTDGNIQIDGTTVDGTFFCFFRHRVGLLLVVLLGHRKRKLTFMADRIEERVRTKKVSLPYVAVCFSGMSFKTKYEPRSPGR